MKKILVPTDFSPAATNAFCYALELARLYDSEIVFLHSFEIPIVDTQGVPFYYATVYETMELSSFDFFKTNLPKLHAIADEKGLSSIKISHVLKDGSIISAINSVVEQEQIDLVVMGTNGATGWTWLFGSSNTSDAIMEVKVPFISVPSEVVFTSINHIGFTTRFREKDIQALRKVVDFAKKVNATVKCLYVKTAESDVSVSKQDLWMSVFKSESVRFFILLDDDVATTITDFIVSQEIDLLAMVTYKRNFFSSLFTKSYTKELTKHIKTPILAFHA